MAIREKNLRRPAALLVLFVLGAVVGLPHLHSVGTRPSSISAAGSGEEAEDLFAGSLLQARTASCLLCVFQRTLTLSGTGAVSALQKPCALCPVASLPEPSVPHSFLGSAEPRGPPSA